MILVKGRKTIIQIKNAAILQKTPRILFKFLAQYIL